LNCLSKEKVSDARINLDQLPSLESLHHHFCLSSEPGASSQWARQNSTTSLEHLQRGKVRRTHPLQPYYALAPSRSPLVSVHTFCLSRPEIAFLLLARWHVYWDASTGPGIDLHELQKTLDAQGIEIVENQKENVLSRKGLAERTKGALHFVFIHLNTERSHRLTAHQRSEFKKIPDEEKLNAFKGLLKGTSRARRSAITA